jgi:hypothetical protein
MTNPVQTPLNNAQRQAQYRARHLLDVEGKAERLNTVIELSAKRALERLASCYGVTQRAMIERLISEAERSTLVQHAKSHEDQTKYFEKQLLIQPVTP